MEITKLGDWTVFLRLGRGRFQGSRSHRDPLCPSCRRKVTTSKNHRSLFSAFLREHGPQAFQGGISVRKEESRLVLQNIGGVASSVPPHSAQNDCFPASPRFPARFPAWVGPPTSSSFWAPAPTSPELLLAAPLSSGGPTAARHPHPVCAKFGSSH